MPAPKGHPAYNLFGEGGRPRKYSTEDIEKYAEEFAQWILEDETRFWFKDFFIERGINSDFMPKWAEENERFRGVYNWAKQLQESRIYKGSMTENYNPGMSKFGLINHHKWAEKTETKVSGDASNPLAFALSSVLNTSSSLVDDE